MSDVLQVTRDAAVLTATINRPEAYNALNGEVLAGIGSAVERAAAEPGVRVLVLTGSGEKAFSAGADLKELQSVGVDAARAKMALGQRVMRAVELSPVPVIAAVNGLALGGGFELILSCTFSVLSQKASLGLPEAGLGLIPGYGGTQRLPRRIGAPAAAHLMLTGERLGAQRAYELGLTPLAPVAPEVLGDTVAAVAAQIAAKGPLAVRAILDALTVGADAPLDAGLDYETALAALALAGRESTEGIGAFLEKRSASFDDPETVR